MRPRATIEPMLAKAVDRLPEGPTGSLLYEPKMDGFRCIAGTDVDRGVSLRSHHGARLNEAFPEIMWAVYDHLPAATVLDGEIVRWATCGRLDFTALQRRAVAARRDIQLLARAEPCHYVAFDVLKVGGREVIGWPLIERRRILEELFASIPAVGVLALGMQTAEVDQALAWYHSLHRVGVEGLVIKAARSCYEPGRRGWSKLRYRATVEVVVGGVTGSLARPVGLLLGRYDNAGRLRVVGRTARLGANAVRLLAPLLTPAGPAHPWPPLLPPGWASSPYGQRDPIAYLRVEPDLVVEVQADVAIDHGRWRHAVRFVRHRADMHPLHLATAEELGATDE
jgi:ATP-dependent DNA ligase